MTQTATRQSFPRVRRRSWWLPAALIALALGADAAFGSPAFGREPGDGAGQVAVQLAVAEPPTWAACDGSLVPADDIRFATFCAGVRAERSMQALSRRYSELWARLATEQRGEFSAAERRWLSSGRYAERDACVAHHTKSGAVAGDLHRDHLAAECLAQVTARRLAHVEFRYAATQPAAAAR